MLALGPQHQLLIAVKPVDFRCGIDGLRALCQRHLSHNPGVGQVFIFRNRKGNAIKCLSYDGSGFWLCQKRLSKGRFVHWPKSSQRLLVLSAQQWQQLLANLPNLTLAL